MISIRKRREELGKSMKDLAAVLGESVTYVSEMERGRRPLPQGEQLRKIAEFLNVPLEELETQVFCADGEYIVNGRRYDEGEVVLELEQHGVKFKGYLRLDGADREAFLASLSKHEREDNLPFYMQLQLNIENSRAVILGEGAPRRG